METEKAGTCLSHSHKRAHGVVETIPAQLVVYTDGSYAKVTRELEWRHCVDCGEPFKMELAKEEDRCGSCRFISIKCAECGAHFQVRNGEFRSKEIIGCPVCGGVNAGAKRGDVTRFSEGSKRNLMQKLNKVKRDVSLVCFVTLTFPDEYFPFIEEPEDWKERLRLFEWRFRREFPGCSYVWRLETEDRKSGEHVGAIFPHFHLLVFGVRLPYLREFVAETWYEIAGCGNPDHFEVHRHEKAVTGVLSRRGVMSYAAKAVGSVMSRELAKALQAKGEHVGRWWGIIAKDIFETFLAVPEVFEMSDKDAVSLMRTFRKAIKAQVLEKWRKAQEEGRIYKKPHRKAFQWRSVAVFMSGSWLRANILRLLSPPGAWCYTATGRRFDVPFCEFING